MSIQHRKVIQQWTPLRAVSLNRRLRQQQLHHLKSHSGNLLHQTCFFCNKFICNIELHIKYPCIYYICQLLLNISSTYPPNIALRINVVNVDAIKEIYVLMYARCCPSSFARTPLKLGQYIHNITVPIYKFLKQIL